MMPAFFKTDVTVFFGGIVTSQSPFFAVAVWAKMSLLIHSMVSPTFAEASAGEITRFSIVIWIVAACAETDITPSASAATIDRGHLGVMRGSLFQCRGDVLGMLLVALEIFRPVCNRLFSSALLELGISVVSSALSTALW